MRKSDIEKRVIDVAKHTIKTNNTVRQTANKFGISKSTVHKDIRVRIWKINLALAKKANKVIDTNKDERYLRGGLATKEKYIKLKMETQ